MRIGLLIIGSLYWDPSPVRCRWRHFRFGCSGVRRVKVPIRYGRRSKKRGNTYTMVFAMSCSTPDRLGSGVVVPARAECCHFTHLLEEASHLWAAERDSEQVGDICADWGKVCILPNPNSAGLNRLLESWQAKIRETGAAYGPISAASEEEAVLDPATGRARFAWPTDSETSQPLMGCDLLLMTAPVPTLTDGRYPTVREIADLWRGDGNDNVSYFYNNRHHGITTFQDEEILAALHGKPPNNATGPLAPYKT